jgi:PAS domain S-box-containing protein
MSTERHDPHGQEIVRRVGERVPLAFGIFLACVGIATFFEFVRFPERRLVMGGVAALYGVLVLAAYTTVVRRPGWAIPVLVGTINVIGVVINVYHARVDASVAMCVWVLTALLCGSAVMFPWGRRAQALASLGALLSYPINLQAPSVDPHTWAAGGAYLLCVVALSVFGASLLGGFVRTGLHLSAALSEREARLQSYFDLSLVGTAIVGPDGRCREVNEEFCRLFGATAPSLLGRPWHDLVVADEREVAQGLLCGALCGAAARMDFRCPRAEDEPLYVTVVVRGLPGPSGAIDHALLLVHDITDRRLGELERERSLERTETARRQAEDASRAKDVFLATVSHELRTPLTPILAWANLLHEGGLGTEGTTRGLDAIQRNARAQARLIDDLLDMSRIVAGEWRLARRPVDLRDLIATALDVVRPTADAKGVALESSLGDEPIVAAVDPDRMQQVVWNLAANGVKFTPRGGRVSVEVEGDADTARIIVRDTGEGIPADFLPHVFDAFRQADGAPTRRHEGLGLGLAIVRALVERHGGAVLARSDGDGATFIVEVPLLPADGLATGPEDRPLAPDPSVSRRPLSGVRVLIVDDDADSNAVVSVLLRTRGAQVRTASSAAEALAIADDWHPDVVVSDIAMPGEDGISLLHALQARRATLGEVPTIALTAHGSGADRVRLLGEGFRAHVTKPFDPAHLAAVVETTAHASAAG